MIDIHSISVSRATKMTSMSIRAAEDQGEIMTAPQSFRIELDRPRCEGHGLCEEAAPNLMHLDDEGELMIDQSEVEGVDVNAARAAVRACPVAALKLS